ncbi:MAG: hypothetical protein GKR87_02605 [Kiritimatiellae bacterium]|nr:hypothetical protein [Kiritimatiellia bacterium]
MDKDIRPLLKEWHYDASGISARWIKGLDQQPKVQLRLDLGLFQMEMDGRPDGTTPRGYPSLLDYYHLLENTTPDISSLSLDETSCSELQQEAVQYYYRYMSLYSLRELTRVIRDTQHNLDLFDLVSRRASDEDLIWQFLQFYPDVRMMHARARAEKSLEDDQTDKAIEVLEQGLHDIKKFWGEYGEAEAVEISQEEEILSDLLHDIQHKKPKSKTGKLRKELAYAISSEDYEKAALLRDKLNELKHD